MFSLSNKIKAVMLISLTLTAYAEDSLRAMVNRIPVNPNATVSEPTTLLIPEESAEGCPSTSRHVFTQIDGEVFRLLTPSGATLCNTSQAGDVAMSVLHGNRTLEERQVLNPTIVSFSVELIGGTAFSGTLTLATVAGVGAIAAAIVALWWGANKLLNTETEPTSSKRGLLPRPQLAEKKRLGRDSPNSIDVGGPPKPNQHDVYVSYSEPNDDVESTDNESQSRDSSIANSCVSQIEGSSSTAQGGCCNVDMVGSEGYNYYSAVGVAAVAADSGYNFQCYQD
ncbi:hypothetical protein L228DRAFT_268452 [Xylona heveae TC161]|uniref:Uncharacterized protein n=1 Tax=Xylona heveae (strain CBS 132557 / TC161) TaxID=1328760 RepID=A0A161TBN7_XYLHT|nr:hypothetical protein L228DRAFT_268452 [Xylona heveae TC161]KZF23097.1 hypothetical protein L228DRAFT_268452 [Xylona heveae TC161]